LTGRGRPDRHPAVTFEHAHALVAGQGALDEASHAFDLPRRIGSVGREDFARDRRHYGSGCSTSSVASGRAKNLNGTNVVPRPGDTCIVAAGLEESPATSPPVGGAKPYLRLRPSGSEIWPSCMWPASTRSKAPGGRKSRTYGKWQRRMRRSALWSRSCHGVDLRCRYARGSTPTSCTRLPRSSTVTASSTSRCAGARSVSPAAREKGSRLCSTSWFPSTTYAAPSSCSRSRREGARRGRR